jgi:hypothetical protein
LDPSVWRNIFWIPKAQHYSLDIATVPNPTFVLARSCKKQKKNTTAFSVFICHVKYTKVTFLSFQEAEDSIDITPGLWDGSKKVLLFWCPTFGTHGLRDHSMALWRSSMHIK